MTRQGVETAGHQMHDLVARLYPLCRSITGDGLRGTLDVLGREIDLEVHEVPSGTRVFDWTVPREWNIRDAYVKDSSGRRVIDFQASNLHVVSYSMPVARTMPLAELRPHLHTLPEHPDWIPYRTSYYAEDWGFCVSDRQLAGLPDGDYEVRIDSTLADGQLTWGEHLVVGQTEDEVLISCHACHPSLANDNLSGIAVATWLAKRLRESSPRYSYRFLFIPGTIGSITWLALHERQAERVRHGLVLACVGDAGALTYKRSRRGDAEIDRVMDHVLARSGRPHRTVEFSPYGYDERQYCSPGFDLPVGCLSRTPYGQYPEYHTSADDLDFVRAESLEDSLEVCWEALGLLEANRRYRNLNPRCEPQLGRRGLYGSIGGRSDAEERQMAMLWVLNLSDGAHSLLDVAERSNLEFWMVAEAARALRDGGLLRPAADHSPAASGDPVPRRPAGRRTRE
jgi:aminopeptidase-like protein